MNSITRTLVPTPQRIAVSASIFGIDFPMTVEPYIFHMTDSMAEDYTGGYWDFYTLSNGAFYMSLDAQRKYQVSCQNYFQGELSGDALGIVACLCAYSHLSFSNRADFARICARQFHWLRDYAAELPDAAAIFRAID
jgi:hypothetical protein